MIGTALRNGLEALGLVPSVKSRQLADSLLQESEAHRLRIRQSQADERAALTAEQSRRFHEVAPRRAAAAATVEQKRAELAAAIDAVREIEYAEREALFALDIRSGRLGWALTESASPMIAECVAALRAAAAAVTYDSITEKRIDGSSVVVWSNHASIARRYKAIFEAIEAIQALVYEPLDDAALQARVDQAWASIPTIEPRPAERG